MGSLPRICRNPHNKSDLWQTSDELLDGKTINSPIGYLNGNSEKILPFTIAFSLFHMDPVYFEHAQKIRKKGETGGFFSQLAAPIIFKSNFSNNALGFFGSYTSVSKRVIFK